MISAKSIVRVFSMVLFVTAINGCAGKSVAPSVAQAAPVKAAPTMPIGQCFDEPPALVAAPVVEDKGGSCTDPGR